MRDDEPKNEPLSATKRSGPSEDVGLVAATLSTRGATFNDLEVFLRLAALSVQDKGLVFDETEARYILAGIPRTDPAINLLIADGEAIGFALVRADRLPFACKRIAREELLFITPEHRSAEAEMLLHAASHELFESWQPALRELQIQPGPYATMIAAQLAESGYELASATARRVVLAQPRPADRILN